MNSFCAEICLPVKSEIAHLLRWYRDSGVCDIDGCIAGALFSLEENVQPLQSSADLSAISDNASAPVSVCESLESLREAMYKAPCDLRYYAKNFVFARGDCCSKVVFVGEAPGADEDAVGLPFVGVSGQLLDKMIASMDLSRESVYVTNIVPWRPPANRTPTADELAIFRPFLIEHMRIVDPEIIVCLGSTSAKALLQSHISISDMRGQAFRLPDFRAEIVPTFHPSYLLRSPGQKKLAWQDFLFVAQRLKARL